MGHIGLKKIFSYNIDGNLLDFVSSHKDLGVLIDPELRFHDHFQSAVRKAGGLAGELLHSTVVFSNFMVSLYHISDQLGILVLVFGMLAIWGT